MGEEFLQKRCLNVTCCCFMDTQLRNKTGCDCVMSVTDTLDSSEESTKGVFLPTVAYVTGEFGMLSICSFRTTYFSLDSTGI